MKKIAIILSLIISPTFILMGQRTSAENFKEFFVPGDYDITGNGIKSSFSAYWGGWPYDWSILCGNCSSRYIPYTSGDGKRWFIAAGGQLGPSYTEDFLPNVINPQTGWTYLINNDFEIRFTNQVQAYPSDWSEDADITIFDPKRIIDKADFKGLKYSEGVEFVLVNGTFVVKDGEIVENTFPGRPILGNYRQ